MTKTEKEKMVAGETYFPHDKELQNLRKNAQRNCQLYNAIPSSSMKQRKSHLKNYLGSTGVFFCIEQPFYCDYGFNIHIGENFFSNYHLTILDCAPVTIGANVMFGPNVSLYTAGHPLHFETRNTGAEYALPISIGDNVWIGGNTVINPGVSIGENTVIGSGSVVTRDIPANCIAVGNPCRVLRALSEADKGVVRKIKA